METAAPTALAFRNDRRRAKTGEDDSDPRLSVTFQDDGNPGRQRANKAQPANQFLSHDKPNSELMDTDYVADGFRRHAIGEAVVRVKIRDREEKIRDVHLHQLEVKQS